MFNLILKTSILSSLIFISSRCVKHQDNILQKKILQLTKEQKVEKCVKILHLNEVYLFKWDKMYLFFPNTSKETIEGLIHVDSHKIEAVPDDTYVLVFIYQNNVVLTKEYGTNQFTFFANNGPYSFEESNFYTYYDSLKENYYLHSSKDTPKSWILSNLLKEGHEICK